MGRRLHQAGVLLLLSLTSSVIYSADHVSAKVTLCDPWAAKIASVQGQVEARRNATTDWQPVALNEIYCPGDQIRVGDNARAAIVLNNETLVRLNQNSAITLAEIKTDGPSLLELLKGIAHFISRVPRSLKVNTPFVNAAIEGTEFVVTIGNQQTEVTVFEGIVLTQNQYGELRITQNETALAKAGSAPQKVLKATPRDAVQWALYFPPVFDQATGKLAIAQQQLYTGQIDAARATLKDDSSAEALSLMTIIAVVQNDVDSALKTAQQAVEKNPQLAAAHIALSYAQQAKRDLAAALLSAKQATAVESNNAVAWARVAELQLSTGDLGDALEAAKRATELNPNLARTQTILGFAYLLQIDIDEAKTAFTRAIELDQVDPLPRLGLGLAKIRKNELAEGRRDIEIAASLDPNNAIIRSYLGKAYFEEKRAPLDAEQFAMAKELDPNDPTPWFYDAIRKQTENDPVGALADLNKSIELNNNRAVYRSSLQLDQDEAARSVRLGNIYLDLGFEQIAINESKKSLLEDPKNSSAHRFLSDAYKTEPRHQIARVSESLQAKLFQEVNLSPNLASENDAKVTLLESSISTQLSLNEYSQLYNRNGNFITGKFLGGSNSTVSEELGINGVNDSLSYSASQYYYSTDGYRENNDLKYNIYNAFVQYSISTKHNIQFEATSRNVEYGDISQRINPDDYSLENRRKIKTDIIRAGYTYTLNNSSKFITSVLYNNEIDNSFTSTLNAGFLTETNVDTNTDGTLGEMQYIYSSRAVDAILGVGHFAQNQNAYTVFETSFGGVPLPPPFSDELTLVENTHHTNTYIYTDFKAPHDTQLFLGASYDNHNGNSINKDNINPKIGFSLDLTESLNFRAAYYEVLRRSLFREQTIEPTHFAGFNQFFDESSSTISENTGVSISYKNKNLASGLNAIVRDLTVPRPNSPDDTRNEKLYTAYFNWIVLPTLALSAEYQYESFESDLVPPITTEVDSIKTSTIPIIISYRPISNLDIKLTSTYVDQEVTDAGIISTSDFTVLDLTFNYDINRNSAFNINIKNLTDREMVYQDKNFLLNESHAPLYIPEITYYIGMFIKF